LKVYWRLTSTALCTNFGHVRLTR